MKKGKYLKSVRDQYEKYPYPARDPEDEKRVLRITNLDTLETINHYCFNGKRDFSGFRALAAGGGTGDAAIFLAEQLRQYDGRVVYIDISGASMEVARERARIRGLTNLDWIHRSILEIPEMDIGRFDYINCSGCLHHLESPENGLAALKSVMKDHSGMGIMIYAKYGRTGVSQIHELMRIINADEEDMQTKIDNTRSVLEELPPSNWFKMSEHLVADHKRGDVGIYDLFLHSQVRTYSIPELFDLIEGAGLNVVEFARGTKLFYRPETYLSNKTVLKKIRSLARKEQLAVAELVAGNIKNHSFYVSNRNETIARLEDTDNIPVQSMCGAPGFMEMYERGRSGPPDFSGKRQERFPQGKYCRLIFKYMDGKRSIREIFDCVRKESAKTSLSDRELLDEFTPAYTYFNSLGWMLLRHKSMPPFTSFNDLQAPIINRYNR